MTPQKIKIKMIELGIRSVDLVREWKEPKSTISMLINRKLVSAELERKLARKLGIKVAELRAAENGGANGKR